MKEFHSVTFLPENKTIQVEHLKTIFETIGEENPHAVELRFSCGAEGICQKCKIRSFQKMGPLTPTEKGCLSDEEIAKGVRLSCQARVIQDMQAEILYKMPFTIELTDEVLTREDVGSSGIAKVHVQSPDGKGLSAEQAIAAIAALPEMSADPEQVESIVRQQYESFFKEERKDCTAVFFEGELVFLEEGDTVGNCYAAAVDLGINTLMVSLVDMSSGKKVAVVTDTNPQLEIGHDYETRVAMVDEDSLNLEILHEEILLRIDILVLELCRAREVSPLHVYEIVVAGTTGMLHLYLQSVPGFLQQQASGGRGASKAFSAEQLYLRSPTRATVYTLPVISASVGADITAGILATGLHRAGGDTVLLLDLGTDVKAVLHHSGRVFATSAAGCGALEGVGITFGMRPETGAIHRVRCSPALHTEVVGESLARGVCGSGLLELISELRRLSVIDDQGIFQSTSAHPALSDRIIEVEGQQAFLLYHDEGEFETDIYVTQADIRHVMHAKAAASAMVDHILEHAGVSFDDLGSVFIAGALGPGLEPEALVHLGILPGRLQKNILHVGNTVKKGTQMALLDRNILQEAEHLAKTVVCIPPVSEEKTKGYLNFCSLA